VSSFARWLSFLDAYPGPDFGYLNHKGIIPPSAVIVKGAKGENHFKEYLKVGNDGAVLASLDEDLDGAMDVKSAEMEG
jgi:tRNA pseudouridine38-40 synthase